MITSQFWELTLSHVYRTADTIRWKGKKGKHCDKVMLEMFLNYFL